MKQLLFLLAITIISVQYSTAQSCGTYGNKNYNNNYGKRASLKASKFETNKPKQAIFMEWNGNGIGKSINFDSRFRAKHNGPGFRVGLGGTDLLRTENGNNIDYSALTIPAELNYILGKKRHSLEAGVGYTTILDSETEGFDGTGFLNFGYRFKPLRKGLVVRANITPRFNTDGLDFGYRGFSLGWGF